MKNTILGNKSVANFEGFVSQWGLVLKPLYVDHQKLITTAPVLAKPVLNALQAILWALPYIESLRRGR
jgi:hypothetical protein